MKKIYSFIEIERDLSPAFAERRTLLRSMSWWCGLLAPVAGQLVVELVRIGEIYRGVSGYLNLVFTSLIHREFQSRGSNRRSHCRDSSGSFVP